MQDISTFLTVCVFLCCIMRKKCTMVIMMIPCFSFIILFPCWITLLYTCTSYHTSS